VNALGGAGSPSRPEIPLSIAALASSQARSESGPHHYLRSTARLTAALAVLLLLPACRHARPSVSASQTPALSATPLAPSPRLVVGRVGAVDSAHGFAFVELASDAPHDAITEGTELIVRTADLRETGRLRASRYVRSRTLGTRIIAGQPTVGDEVVWLAP
jgi:hypothetical protein